MRYLILLLLLCSSLLVEALTTNTVTVAPSGGDYTSLSAALVANRANLVAADQMLHIVISGTWASPDTTYVSEISGWTVDATRTVRVIVTGDALHNGKWSDTAYRLVVNDGATTALRVDYSFQFYGLQVQNLGSGWVASVWSASGTGWVGFESCIFRGGTGVNCEGPLTYVTHSLLYGSGGSGLNASSSASVAVAIYNCTIVNNAVHGLYNSGSGTVNAYNCYSGGNGTSDYTSISAFTTSMSADSVSRSGVTANVALSTANFMNTTNDFHITEGSALRGAGTDLGSFSFDIDGEARSAPWDVGMDQWSGEEAPSFPKQSAGFFFP